MSRIIKQMKKPDEWIELERRDQYTMLGYNHDTSKLLHITDYSQLKQNPTAESAPDFLWHDINLTKKQGAPPTKFTLGNDHPNKEEFVILKAHCAGVKVYT